jgi:hypothetical protein
MNLLIRASRLGYKDLALTPKEKGNHRPIVGNDERLHQFRGSICENLFGKLSSDCLKDLRRKWPDVQPTTQNLAKVTSSPGGEDTGEGELKTDYGGALPAGTLSTSRSTNYPSLAAPKPRRRRVNQFVTFPFLPCHIFNNTTFFI